MTKTSKLAPLVIDEPTMQIINKIAKASNATVSKLQRDWIRNGIVGSPFFTASNPDNLSPAQICVVNKHGRPKKAKSPVPGVDGPGPDPIGAPGVAGATGCSDPVGPTGPAKTTEGVADNPTMT